MEGTPVVLLTAAAGAVALVVGLLVALALGLGERSRAELAVGALAATLLLLTLEEKALLLAGWFRPLPLLLALLLSLAAALCLPRARLSRASLNWPSLNWRGPLRAPLVWAVTAVTAAVYGFQAAVAVRLPPRDIDSLWYHLVSIAGWVRTGSLASPIAHLSAARSLGWTVVSDSYPRDTELIGAFLSVFTHDTSLVALTQLPFAALLLLAVYGLARRLGAARGLAWCAACAVLLAPVVVSQAGMAYNDIARAAVPAAAWLVLLAACTDREGARERLSVRQLLFAGALFGLGLGIKPANAYLLAVALPTAVWLRGGRDRLRAPLLLGAPAVLVGGFWYALAWRRWGSPVWPLRMGPFRGPMTMYDLVDSFLPKAWRGSSLPVQVLRSWLDAFPALGRPHWYVSWTGLLGLGWLLFLLPAVVLLTARAVRRPELRVASFGVVLPLVAGTLAAPGAWFSRYTMPLLVAGAVAFAVLGAHPRRTRVTGWLTGALVLCTCLGLVSGFRWSTYWRIEDPKQLNAAGTAALIAGPEAAREHAGIWGSYPAARSLPDAASIGFCDEDPPVNWFPMLLIGPRYQRTLVDLGRCGSPSGATARVAARGADFVYATCASRIGVGLAADPARFTALTPTAPRAACWLRLYRPTS
ncbi:hypothetical protein ABIA32_001356 [Streptacidiphilus sp. MAP12-20]|uniref:glycosyltransferase family 39 protein n=1 Tax=Streptacidiphilus sp. MAP12-20 TaxID=3156299 RepID=UPI003511F70C